MRHCAYFEMKIFIHFFIEIFLLKIKKKKKVLKEQSARSFQTTQ